MKNILSKFLDLIYKRKCYFCKNSYENKIMCQKCYDSIILNSKAEVSTILGCKVYCATCYKNATQKLIRAVKYHNKKDLAYYQAMLMVDYFNELNLNEDFVIVPVPLFKAREKKRGYNHMDLVGEEFCVQTRMKLNNKLVSRVKDTKPQYNLNKQQRQKNLKDAFSVNIEGFDVNSKVLLIDDIFTTGSTFEAIIKELKKSGINDITCFATSMAV